LNERPKSREETPKEGSGTAWRAIPHCNNMSLQRTKIKVCKEICDRTETVMPQGHASGWDPGIQAAAVRP